MTNFTYCNPVKIIFGKETIAQLAELVPPGTKIMLVYGGGSIKRNGVYDQVVAALTKHTVIEFGGIEANPQYATCLRAAAVARSEGVDFVLAVGGGSVIDATKFIVSVACYPGEDPWRIVLRQDVITQALPYGVVLTLPATGSEMNDTTVISRTEIGEKRAYASPLLYPQFSILDPSTTFSLPKRQVANGIVDTFVHVMEQYMCAIGDAPLTERMSEAVLVSLIEAAAQLPNAPDDYNLRATLVWCATVGLNGSLGCGVAAQDWTTHLIGHELTALYGLDHAQTLAIIMPALHRWQFERKKRRLAQCATRVWGICEGDEATRAHQAIERMEEFFHSLDVPTKLSAYNIDADAAAQAVAARLTKRGVALGEYQDISGSVAGKIVLASR